jgi:hypothetical protein
MRPHSRGIRASHAHSTQQAHITYTHAAAAQRSSTQRQRDALVRITCHKDPKGAQLAFAAKKEGAKKKTAS